MNFEQPQQEDEDMYDDEYDDQVDKEITRENPVTEPENPTLK